MIPAFLGTLWIVYILGPLSSVVLVSHKETPEKHHGGFLT